MTPREEIKLIISELQEENFPVTRTNIVGNAYGASRVEETLDQMVENSEVIEYNGQYLINQGYNIIF